MAPAQSGSSCNLFSFDRVSDTSDRQSRRFGTILFLRSSSRRCKAGCAPRQFFSSLLLNASFKSGQATVERLCAQTTAGGLVGSIMSSHLPIGVVRSRFSSRLISLETVAGPRRPPVRHSPKEKDSPIRACAERQPFEGSQEHNRLRHRAVGQGDLSGKVQWTSTPWRPF